MKQKEQKGGEVLSLQHNVSDHVKNRADPFPALFFHSGNAYSTIHNRDYSGKLGKF